MDITIKNLDTGKSVTFDNKNFILNSHTLDNVSVQHNTSRTIKQVGEYIESTNVSSRPVNFIGYAIGLSPLDLASKKELLLNITSPFSEIEIIANNKYKITGKCVNPVKWANNWDNNNDKFVKFSIDLLCPSTLWYALEPTTVALSPFVDTFNFPVSIVPPFSFGHRVPNKLTNIYNPTNVNLPLTITLTATADVTNPTITNTITNKSFILNTTITPQDTIIITTEFANKTVTKNGKNIIGQVDLLNSSWLMLNAGLNTFTFSTENTKNDPNLLVNFSYNQAYWGVV